MTLNQIAEDGAYKLGDQFNNTLRESIKHTVIYFRAKYIRDDVSRNGSPSPELYQPAILEMQEVNKLEDVGASIDCITEGGVCYNVINNIKYKILKSKKPLPKSVRLKGTGFVGYKFVGSVDRSVRFHYSEPADLKFKQALPYRKFDVIYFFIADNYLYLLNSLEICNVLIDGIFENPRDVYRLCEDDTFIDDKEFPLPNDMLVSIMDNIVKSYPTKAQDGQVINIQRDDKDQSNV